MFEILECFIKGKTKLNTDCEDSIVSTKELIAVIDGVTSKVKTFQGIETPGKIASKIITNTILSERSLYKFNSVDFFELINSRLVEYVKKNGYKDGALKASIIVYNDYYKEIWSYGDCQCLLGNRLYKHEKKIDVILSELRSFYLNLFIKDGYTINELLKNDLGRKKIMDMLISQSSFENDLSEFGYPVLNGKSIQSKYIKKYPVENNSVVVLASDGYPFLYDTLDESERALKSLLKNDPLLYKVYKSTKGLEIDNDSFDDRSYIKFVPI